MRAENVHIRNLTEPHFSENMISHLVMSDSRLKTLKALAKSFARITQHNEPMKDARWSADFVRGKGNGLIFLLHGKPGVGKTCTAGKRPFLMKGNGQLLITCLTYRVHRRVYSSSLNDPDEQRHRNGAP